MNDFSNIPGLTAEVAEKFEKSLKAHIAAVQEAGRQLGVSEVQLSLHDESKWTFYEFPGYAIHFQGGGAPDMFAAAWLHHIHENEHHWEHWLFPDNYTPKGSTVENGCVFMPYNFALEMVADWMGASFAYTGSWDMTDWLFKNWGRVRFHSRSRAYIREVLAGLGYTDMVLEAKS